MDIHHRYGGVVPELASRDHICKQIPLVRSALQQAGITSDQIDLVAYTAGPGLVGALFVGASLGQSIAWALNKPAIAIHHMEAHLLVPFIHSKSKIHFPFLCLLVSGGHTQLVHVRELGNYELLGESRDDAVGEAFDKVAKQLGLGYPGGPQIEVLAHSAQGNLKPFPRPMMDDPGLDFSFSGLKTHSLLTFQRSNQSQSSKAEIAFAFQQAVIDTLFGKSQRALEQRQLDTLVIAGGVSANQALRKKFLQLEEGNYKLLFPQLDQCTDNGVMIAYAGMLYALKGVKNSSSRIDVFPKWPLAQCR